MTDAYKMSHGVSKTETYQTVNGIKFKTTKLESNTTIHNVDYFEKLDYPFNNYFSCNVKVVKDLLSVFFKLAANHLKKAHTKSTAKRLGQ